MAKRVLLIEDDDLLRDLYQRQLQVGDLITDAFANGKDGFAALQKNQYDLILLDIMLPDTNGLDILKTIRQGNVQPTIPIILLTNLGQESIIKQGFDLGADGYLIKASYTPDQIVEEVKNLLEGKPNNLTRN